MRTRRVRWTPYDVPLHLRNTVYVDGHFHRRRLCTWRDLVWDFAFRIVLPVVVFLLFAVTTIGLIYIVIALGRAVRSIGGIP